MTQDTREVTVPLSEHEQQLLEQMEQALYAEDPKFASQMQGRSARSARRRYIIGGVGVLLGLGLVLTGISTSPWVGAVGFVVMVAAVAYAATPPRKGKAALGTVQQDGTVRQPAGRVPGSKPAKGARGGAGKSRQAGFMQRLEQRWERRRNDPY